VLTQGVQTMGTPRHGMHLVKRLSGGARGALDLQSDLRVDLGGEILDRVLRALQHPETLRGPPLPVPPPAVTTRPSAPCTVPRALRREYGLCAARREVARRIRLVREEGRDVST